AGGVETVGSLDAALELARRSPGGTGEGGEACVIGGGEIFKAAMPFATRLKVTHVLAAPEGDTFFPPIDPQVWELVSEQEFPAGEKDSHPTRYAIYERRASDS